MLVTLVWHRNCRVDSGWKKKEEAKRKVGCRPRQKACHKWDSSLRESAFVLRDKIIMTYCAALTTLR